MKLLIQLAAISTLILMAACGSQTDNPAVAPAPGPGIVTPNQCAAGQIYTSQYGCLPLDAARCGTNAGYYAPTGQCIPAGVIGGTVQRYAGQVSVVDRRQFEWYMNDSSLIGGSYYPSAFCENYGNVYGGNYPCSYFSAEAGVAIQGTGAANQFQVQIAPLRQHPYGRTMPALTMQLFPQNDGTTFALQQNTGFSLARVIGRGQFGSTNGMEIEVTYKGVTFARGVIYPQ